MMESDVVLCAGEFLDQWMSLVEEAGVIDIAGAEAAGDGGESGSSSPHTGEEIVGAGRICARRVGECVEGSGLGFGVEEIRIRAGRGASGGCSAAGVDAFAVSCDAGDHALLAFRAAEETAEETAGGTGSIAAWKEQREVNERALFWCQ